MFLPAFSPYSLSKIPVNFPLAFTHPLWEGRQHPKDFLLDTEALARSFLARLDARDQRGRLLVFNYYFADRPCVLVQGSNVAALVLSPK